ncbi:MAG: 50S ribosomal protein L21 [Candidatus Nomurabacteria bacterium]|jgi:large subunit ribosomal protein L21|nr:50S ribosomal protein L21 [Candidatus Nomurabacteria bacterium]
MKAVIKLGGKQYIVAEKERLLVDRLPDGSKDLSLDALLIFDEKGSKIGQPTVKDIKVTAKVTQPEIKGDKVQYIRYKSKKRVHKVSGHRQQYSEIEIVSIK